MCIPQTLGLVTLGTPSQSLSVRAGKGGAEGELIVQSRDGVGGAAFVQMSKDVLTDESGQGGEKSPHTPCLMTTLGHLGNILPKNIYLMCQILSRNTMLRNILRLNQGQ